MSSTVSARQRRAWSATNPGNQAIRAELLELVLDRAAPHLAGDAPVLDVGCGTGWLLAALAENGIAAERLHGIELSEERVEATRSRVAGADVRQGDARVLPFENDRFGLVTLVTVLSSVGPAADIRRCVAEATRVLEPGGLLLCYEPRVPNPLNRRTRMVRLGGFRASGAPPTDVRSLTVVPALARTLTGRLPGAYDRLATLPFLRTHRLVAHRKPARGVR
jgi:ubiquinone/menaquinone biosynthesis C-methylase UbiE